MTGLVWNQNNRSKVLKDGNSFCIIASVASVLQRTVSLLIVKCEVGGNISVVKYANVLVMCLAPKGYDTNSWRRGKADREAQKMLTSFVLEFGCVKRGHGNFLELTH